jgi:hypothetical protein
VRLNTHHAPSNLKIRQARGWQRLIFGFAASPYPGCFASATNCGSDSRINGFAKTRCVAFNGPLDRCRPKNGVEELSDRNGLLAVPFLGDSFGFPLSRQGSLPSICSEGGIDIPSLRRCSCFVGRLQREKASSTAITASLHTTPWYIGDARPSYNLCGRHVAPVTNGRF